MRKRPIAWAALLLFLLLQLVPAVSFYREPQITEKCKGQVTGRVTRRTRKEEQLQLNLADCQIKTENSSFETTQILVYLTDETDYPVGAVLSLSGTIYPMETPTNPGQFDSRLYYEGKGIICTVYADSAKILNVHASPVREALMSLRERMEAVYEVTFDESKSGLMKAMILGQKGSLDKEMKELYQRNGIAHLLAISGVKTLKLDIPLVPETRINWAFVPLHIAIIYILKLCLDEEIIPRCRFPCSRGYLTKCINWQKK